MKKKYRGSTVVPWYHPTLVDSTKNLLLVFSFRVVTYNILADIYADSDFSRDYLFPHCPAEILRIDYRKQLLLKELTGFCIIY